MNRFMLSLLLLALPALGQDTRQDEMKDCPMHAQHAAESHQSVVKGHGDQAMGFPHDKTTHHFLMTENGGAIEVTANDPGDKADTAAIHSHLSNIATMFSNGDFSTPMFIHDGVPPGVTTMKLMKSAIRYKYEEMPVGGIIRIKSDDPVAVAAIHDFLRFQITEHRTGDRLGGATR
jgi:TusA-related sulfurtransferase